MAPLITGRKEHPLRFNPADRGRFQIVDHDYLFAYQLIGRITRPDAGNDLFFCLAHFNFEDIKPVGVGVRLGITHLGNPNL